MSEHIAADLAVLARPIEELRTLPGNPRVGDVEAIARSLARFGQRKPVVARRDGTVIAGNHTLAAARDLGWSTLAAVYVDDDDTMAYAYALADNRTAELGGYDEDALAELVAEIGDLDPDLLADTGWTGDDLLKLLGTQSPRILADPDDVPDAPTPITEPGDVWLLGRHRLVCGDCRNGVAVQVALDGAKADMVWTDPPYGVAYVGGYSHQFSPQERLAMGGATIENDTFDTAKQRDFLRAAFDVALAASRPGACWFVTAPQGPLFRAFAEVLDDIGVWRQTLAWVKDSLVMGRSDYHYRHEALFFGWTPGAGHIRPDSRATDSVWEVARPKRSTEHPTMKPVALITPALENHTKVADLVLDPFGGSGTTLIAAQMTNRCAALVEIDAHYCDVICARYQLLTDESPVRESTGEPVNFL